MEIQRLATDPQPIQLTGHSGYFSKPVAELDPHLFEGKRVRPAARAALLGLLYKFWDDRYSEPKAWSTVWIAGSAASHQWAADRGGVGDLDVLIGVDFSKFRQANRQFVGTSDAAMATQLNHELHDELWPTTATYDLGGRPYEATFYINPGAADIRSISPYAAYDLTHDKWTVKPIELPAEWGPASLPGGWWRKFHADAALGMRLLERYQQQKADVEAFPAGHPRWVNAATALHNTGQQATALFDEIHLGRKDAFAPGGAGFISFQNSRWQHLKLTGLMEPLRSIRAETHR